jgi:hypothetical protein
MPSWGEGEIRLSERMSFVEQPAPPGMLSDKKQTLADVLKITTASSTAVYLRVRAAGYGAARMDATAMGDAISHIKHFFQLFRREEAFEMKRPSLADFLRYRHRLVCYIVDPAFPDEKKDVDLPERLSRFLASASINEAKLTTYDGFGLLSPKGPREAKTREERVDILQSKIKWITNLMDCPPDWPDADHIKAALEWGFDAQESDNQTLSFIQASIGLEALLGEKVDKDDPLTARLADRCAYLLGKTHRDREQIRERFKVMYRVRSKLVHGRSARLSLFDASQLTFARNTLEAVITEEARRLLKALDAKP